MMYFFLTLSVALNIFLIWYARKLLINLAYISETIMDTLDNLSEFSKHLQSVHELETFYGEPVLQDLIKHSKQMVEDVKVYKEIYTLFEEGVEGEEEFEEEKDG